MTAIIILAAGTSSRLGRPKQTLQYKEGSLLRHAIKAAVDSAIGPVYVVTGANEEEICANIENEAVTIVANKDYNEGVASSIRAGVAYASHGSPDLEAVILTVCDQPYVDENVLKNLFKKKTVSGKPIVACSYDETIGVPALFDRSLFSELLQLKNEEGGKKVLFKHPDLVAVIPFPDGNIDIDTRADYDALIR